MGAGKTTARGAFLRDYMTAHGGVCMALDAPAEADLDGEYGHGQIFQQDLQSEIELVEALRDSLRSSADVISPGEVTRDEVAIAVLTLATSGHLVPTTFHADDLIGGLARFNRSIGGRSEAFAEALSVAIHLSLAPKERPQGMDTRPGGGLPGRLSPPERRLTVTPLFVSTENKEQIRSHIRAGQFQQLSSEIDRQRRLMLAGGVP
jgi:twitching motility protein PilT